MGSFLSFFWFSIRYNILGVVMRMSVDFHLIESATFFSIESTISCMFWSFAGLHYLSTCLPSSQQRGYNELSTRFSPLSAYSHCPVVVFVGIFGEQALCWGWRWWLHLVFLLYFWSVVAGGGVASRPAFFLLHWLHWWICGCWCARPVPWSISYNISTRCCNRLKGINFCL